MNSITKHIGLGALLLLAGFGNSVASVNPASSLPHLGEKNVWENGGQQAAAYSLHETTELAEQIWTELTNRFVMHYEHGQYEQAKQVAQRAYDIASVAYGIDNTNTADSLLKLGIVSQSFDDLIAAKAYLLDALAILERQLSPGHPDTAIALTNLGNIYFSLQKYELSQRYHQRALDIRTHAYGPAHPSVAQSNYNLAVLHDHQKHYPQAESLYRKAIDSWTITLGPNHPYVANAVSSLTNIYIAQNKLQEAADVLQNWVKVKKSFYGGEHQEVAQSLLDLGTLYVEQGKYRTASKMYEEALGIAEHVLNPSDPQLAMLMYILANVYHVQARMSDQDADESNPSSTADKNKTTRMASLFARALPLYVQAADILDADITHNKPELDIVLSELTLLYKALGNQDMANQTQSRLTLAQ
ncbi:MAG: tetratricopeptide repeat protein [Gammaproteobacteria bacterium]|nr:tetratricopeptide repeat protein [Gammaproteobacteria bacterium]